LPLTIAPFEEQVTDDSPLIGCGDFEKQNLASNLTVVSKNKH